MISISTNSQPARQVTLLPGQSVVNDAWLDVRLRQLEEQVVTLGTRVINQDNRIQAQDAQIARTNTAAAAEAFARRAEIDDLRTKIDNGSHLLEISAQHLEQQLESSQKTYKITCCAGFAIAGLVGGAFFLPALPAVAAALGGAETAGGVGIIVGGIGGGIGGVKAGSKIHDFVNSKEIQRLHEIKEFVKENQNVAHPQSVQAFNAVAQPQAAQTSNHGVA